ncbi:MAG TPA: RHS repeat-associated core domain-containing protein, partial [Ktedonobacterales bacterium]|nr:RHS repeat-associated core domain-containing protein [Ktedonobacterales bacterium]
VTAGTRDPSNTLTSSGLDYRVLQPQLVMDANRNRSAVAFDALGMVVGTAVMGKPEETLGDTLDNFTPDLADGVIAAHLQDPFINPQDLLQQASTRLVYDLFAYQRTQTDPQPQPAVVYTLARETHAADLAQGQSTRIQHSFSYSDGFGREIQKKIQAEPGPLAENGPTTNPRWVGSGWTIFNNKGKPVRQYEPFFSATHHFEFALTLGVSAVLFYDPIERVTATLHPNHTYGKVVFDPWKQTTWDLNDTALLAPKADPDVGSFFQRLPDTEYLPTWYDQRQGGALGAQEQAAAAQTAAHANTPTTAYLDTLGRTFLTVARNHFVRNNAPVDEYYATRLTLDIQGRQREISDARSRVVLRHDYDLPGASIHQASMEAGERWLLNDVTGKPIRAWDSRGHTRRTVYDALRRPLEQHLSTGGGPESLVGRTIYGETQATPEAQNLRGHVYQVDDEAGIVTSDAYDFKGNLLHTIRQLVSDYMHTPDWSTSVALDGAIYTSSTTYDALNRPVTLTTPDNTVMRPTYNEASLLESLAGNLRGATTPSSFVTNIDYNAKGQRVLIAYGNGASTSYTYDPQTFRLTHLFTTRGACFPGDGTNPASPPVGAQNLRYTYDPVGNITHMQDAAQQTIYFNNRQIEPSADYTYDAVYRLIAASGREHLGQAGGGGSLAPLPLTFDDGSRVGLPQPGDGNALGRYLQQYSYDEVGNILQMQHSGTNPANPGWTQAYTYNEPSLLEAGKVSNRLTSTQAGQSPAEPYTYDAHGNITSMAHLPLMQWDEKDQLQATAQQVVNNGGTPETTYYVYDASGQRVRKVTERQAAQGQTPTRLQERVYLGGFEVYREYGGDGSTIALERETLHIMDDKQRVAIIETRTQGSDDSPAQLIRYQFSNHLGTACLELDAQAQIISYEEYYPFGSTSYQAARSQTETPKRYRYSGQERDEESGFYYHGARYYACWLGRWTAADPAGMVDGDNLYRYSRNNPIKFNDPNGMDPPQPPPPGEYRLSLTNPVSDPLAHANYFDLLIPGLLGLGLRAADLGNRTSNNVGNGFLRLGEFAASFFLMYGPEVLSHEVGGHVGTAQRYGSSASLIGFGWFSGLTSPATPALSPSQETAFVAAGVNQQVMNAGATYERVARSGYFTPQDALAYLLGQGGTPGYALRSLAKYPTPTSGTSDDIINYTSAPRTWSREGIAAASMTTALPSLIAAVWSGWQFVVNNQRTLEIPSLHLGSTRLTFPHLRTLLTSDGTVLGASTLFSLGRDQPAFEFSLDVRPTSDFAVAVGARAYGLRIPGFTRLEVNPYLRATFANPLGISAGVETRLDASSRLGFSIYVGGRINDLLGETEGRSGGFEGGAAGIVRF